jgi:ribosomal protein L18
MPWTRETSIEYAEQLGVSLAEQALAQGASEIIREMDVTSKQEHQRV